jgi:hypothetical protein
MTAVVALGVAAEIIGAGEVGTGLSLKETAALGLLSRVIDT